MTNNEFEKFETFVLIGLLTYVYFILFFNVYLDLVTGFYREFSLFISRRFEANKDWLIRLISCIFIFMFGYENQSVKIIISAKQPLARSLNAGWVTASDTNHWALPYLLGHVKMVPAIKVVKPVTRLLIHGMTLIT